MTFNSRTNVSTTVKTESLDSNSNCDQSASGSDTQNLNKSFAEKVDSWGIIKMADFPLVDGSRQHFWKESFVKNVMLVRSIEIKYISNYINPISRRSIMKRLT